MLSLAEQIPPGMHEGGYDNKNNCEYRHICDYWLLKETVVYQQRGPVKGCLCQRKLPGCYDLYVNFGYP